MKIPFNKPFIAGKELYFIAEAVLKNKHLSGNGPFTRRCEEWLENTLGCGRAMLTHSCTAALEMVALLTDIQPGDEVIMPSFTFVSTANAFALRGAVPVFVDIRPDTLNIDEQLIAQAVTPRTKGIVPVHYAGLPCAMEEIQGIAKENGLWIAEDAAQAMLATYNGKYLGTIGDFGCLSFHETKNIISGEGGALLLNSPDLIERAEIVREKGTNRTSFFRGEIDKYTWLDVGSSFLPSDLIAAFLFAQLEHAHRIIAARRKLMDEYDRLLAPLEAEGFFRLPYVEKKGARNGHLYYIITRSLEERTELVQYLARQGIGAVFHYVPLHSSPAGRKFGRSAGDLPVTDDVSMRLLRMPLFYEMTMTDVQTVALALQQFFTRR